MEPVSVDITDVERRIMSEVVVEKTWQVPACCGKGPVTITLQLPEVTITDSEGRYIVIAPQQAEIVSSRMDEISCWMNDIPDE
jgi:hypothetical protein